MYTTGAPGPGTQVGMQELVIEMHTYGRSTLPLNGEPVRRPRSPAGLAAGWRFKMPKISLRRPRALEQARSPRGAGFGY